MPRVNTKSIENQVYKVNSTTTYDTAGSSSTSPVLLRFVEVEPATFTVGDVVTVEAVVTKSGSSGTWAWGLYWNNKSVYDITTDIPIALDITFAAGVTYSNCYKKLVIGGTAASVLGTGTWNPENGTYFADVFYQGGGLGDLWTRVGTNTDVGNSIDWDTFGFSPIDGSYVNGGFFKIIGYVNNASDRIRVEWMKVSGFASGTFIIPSGNVRGAFSGN